MTSQRPVLTRSGFTLIELIVVMAVLSVVLVLTAVLSSQAIDLRGATKARIVSERTAAAFMRQFEADLAQRITRREARTRFDKQSGNDEISLLTQRPGYAIRTQEADRRAALVSYRVNRQLLERAASGYGFGASDGRPDEQAGTLALVQVPLDGPPPADDRAFQVIAPGLIRLEFSFLVREGDTRVVRADPPRDQERIEAVIATVVTLDPDRSRMLDEAGFRLITGEFPDATDGEPPAREWMEIAANLARKLPKLPKPATQQVRVHQGIFKLPNWNSPP
jgi:prepilin-type N-terminal cleavage/methylation domain-containing protein